MKKAIAVTALLGLLGLSIVAQAAITIDTVFVDDAGNAADSTGYGAVAYNYNIGKYEVTVGQYTAFLNAVATTDTFGLYSTLMIDTYCGCGITQSGVSGSYTYSVVSGWADKPINNVSYWDACRFANWLNNGQPTGLQDTTTTENGAYTLTANGITYNTITRNAGAIWAITSENEWYKAAYYKSGGTNAGYWAYPTQSNSINTGMANSVLDHTTDVGSYPYPSAYGTYDQGGNVWEWTESIWDRSQRIRRGGGTFFSNIEQLRSSWGDSFISGNSSYNVGFRVSQAVPEPSSILALAGGIAGLGGLILRRKKN